MPMEKNPARSDAARASKNKWEAANRATLGVRLNKDDAEAFRRLCAAAGKTVNAALVDHVRVCLDLGRLPGAPAPHPAPPTAAEQPPEKSPASPAPSLADLMAIRAQKLADKIQEEQLEHPGQVRPAEQPPKPSLLPPTRDLDTSNVPPDLAAAMERAASAQAEMHARLNSAEKNSPASGTNVEQR